MTNQQPTEEQKGRYKGRWIFKRFQLLCSECDRWFDADKSTGYDDENGYPHWGYPICPLCEKPNKNAKILPNLIKYYDNCPRYISEHELYLLRR